MNRFQYCGKNAYVAAYPMAMGKLINVVGFVSKSALEQNKERLEGAELQWPADMPWVETVKSDEVLKVRTGLRMSLPDPTCNFRHMMGSKGRLLLSSR